MTGGAAGVTPGRRSGPGPDRGQAAGPRLLRPPVSLGAGGPSALHFRVGRSRVAARRTHRSRGRRGASRQAAATSSAARNFGKRPRLPFR
jgi:hypothetical protein